MKLVIDIPDIDYEHIKEYYEKNDDVEATYSYIYHGKPLPKNHGNIYDENDLRKLGAVYFESNIRAVNDKGPWRYKDISLVISAKPIIPAERENEE